MKNFKQLRQEQTAIAEATSAEKLHAAALEASAKAKQSPSAINHRAASDAHEAAIGAHEKAINALIKKDGSADDVKTHEQHIKMHKNEAQKHRFAAHRLDKSQKNEGTVTETKWKVTFVHKHPEGDKKHEYEVDAPHQNAADKKAIAMHRQAHPIGDFHMWNSEELYEAGLEDACWKGYEAIGMKMKNGRKVPNCVPKEEIAEEPKIKVSVNRPIGHRIADIGPGGKEYNVQTKDWPETAATHHQAAHSALAKGDVETYHKEMDKKFASHQAAEKEAAKKPVKTYEATEFTPNQGVLALVKRDHEDLKNKSTKEVLAIHQGQHRVRSNYTAAEVGGKHAMIGDILRNRHGNKHVAHYFGLKEASTTIEKPVAEESDDQKNLKITRHEKMAVEAGKRGDKQAQQYHLNIVKKLQNESVVAEAKAKAKEDKLQKHLVTVTVTDPHHAMQSKRKEKIMKRVKVSAADPKEAVKKAESHYKKHGFKVHDSLHHSVVTESLDTDEFVDSYDPEQDDVEEIRMAKAQLKEIADMAQDLVDAMEDNDQLEPWMQYKITSANKDLTDVYSTIAYGEDDDEDNSEEGDERSETDSGDQDEKN